MYSALILNRARGLYGRILSEAGSTDERGQDSLIQADYARLIRFLLYGKQEKFNSFNETGLHLELRHVSRQNFTLHEIVM